MRAANPYEAWQAIRKKYTPEVLFTLDGEAYTRASTGLACRARDTDVNAGHARALFISAVKEEIPIAAEEMALAVEGKHIAAPTLRRLLAERGLLTHDGEDCTITDLGRAFVRRAQAAL